MRCSPVPRKRFSVSNPFLKSLHCPEAQVHHADNILRVLMHVGSAHIPHGRVMANRHLVRQHFFKAVAGLNGARGIQRQSSTVRTYCTYQRKPFCNGVLNIMAGLY